MFSYFLFLKIGVIRKGFKVLGPRVAIVLFVDIIISPLGAT